MADSFEELVAAQLADVEAAGESALVVEQRDVMIALYLGQLENIHRFAVQIGDMRMHALVHLAAQAFYEMAKDWTGFDEVLKKIGTSPEELKGETER